MNIGIRSIFLALILASFFLFPHPVYGCHDGAVLTLTIRDNKSCNDLNNIALNVEITTNSTSYGNLTIPNGSILYIDTSGVGKNFSIHGGAQNNLARFQQTNGFINGTSDLLQANKPLAISFFSGYANLTNVKFGRYARPVLIHNQFNMTGGSFESTVDFDPTIVITRNISYFTNVNFTTRRLDIGSGTGTNDIGSPAPVIFLNNVSLSETAIHQIRQGNVTITNTRIKLTLESIYIGGKNGHFTLFNNSNLTHQVNGEALRLSGHDVDQNGTLSFNRAILTINNVEIGFRTRRNNVSINGSVKFNTTPTIDYQNGSELVHRQFPIKVVNRNNVGISGVDVEAYYQNGNTLSGKATTDSSGFANIGIAFNNTTGELLHNYTLRIYDIATDNLTLTSDTYLQSGTVKNEAINAQNGTTQTLYENGVETSSDTISVGGETLTRNSNYTINYQNQDHSIRTTVTFINVNNSAVGSNGLANYTWKRDLPYRQIRFTGNCDPTDSGGGVWNINSKVVCVNEDLTINYSINVLSGGNVTLHNTKFKMNGTVHGSRQINVTSGGRMSIIKGSNITNGPFNASAYYDFFVLSGAQFEMKDSFMSFAGSPTGSDGLKISASGTNITNSTFKFSSLTTRGIWIVGGTNSKVFSNTIQSNPFNGITVESNSNNISNNVIGQSGENGILVTSNQNTITFNNIACSCTDALDVRGNTNLITNNDITQQNSAGSRAAIDVSGSDNHFIDNNISTVSDTLINGATAGAVRNNLTVTKRFTFQNGKISLRGNVTVTGTGNLTLKNVKVEINSSTNREYKIEALSNSEFRILQGSNITRAGNFNYDFFVRSGSAFEMRDSYSRYAGAGNTGSQGIKIEADSANFTNNTIESSNSVSPVLGLWITGSLANISGNMFNGPMSNAIHIQSVASSNHVIFNNTISNDFINGFGIRLESGTGNSFSSNKITSYRKSLDIQSSNNLLSENNITVTGSADAAIILNGGNSFDNHLVDNSISAPNGGLLIDSRSGAVNNNLTITKNITYQNARILLAGNVTVNGTLANLTLRGVTLQISSSTDGEYDINASGELRILQGSNITRAGIFNYDFFVMPGAKFEMRDSFQSFANNGINITAHGVNITNSSITNNSNRGILFATSTKNHNLTGNKISSNGICIEAGAQLDDTKIINNTIENCSDAFYTDNVLVRVNFSQNWINTTRAIKTNIVTDLSIKDSFIFTSSDALHLTNTGSGLNEVSRNNVTVSSSSVNPIKLASATNIHLVDNNLSGPVGTGLINQTQLGALANSNINLNITKNIVYRNGRIVLPGNTTVTGTGNLTLQNVTLEINSSSTGQYKINSSGRIAIVQGSNITRAGNFDYDFYVERGGAIEIKDSRVSNAGTIGGSNGIWIKSNGANITNSIIVNGRGLRFQDSNYHNISYNNISSNSGGIDLNIVDNSTIDRNNITTNRIDSAAGISFFNSVDYVKITNNNITAVGTVSTSHGIALDDARDTEIINNSIFSNSSSAYAVKIFRSNRTNLVNNNITGSSQDILLEQEYNATFRKILSDQNISVQFNDVISSFNFSNTTGGEISVAMTVNQSGSINRSAVTSWNTSRVQWNDTAKDINGTYNVSGLEPDTQYAVRKNGVKYLLRQSDASGKINFEVVLPNMTQITLVKLLSPKWFSQETNLPPNGVYNESVETVLRINWTELTEDDQVTIDTVYVEGNWSGIAANYTMKLQSGTTKSGIYNYTSVLPAGVHYWKSFANNSDGASNTSSTIVFEIKKADVPVRLALNGTESDRTFTYGNTTNATGWVEAGITQEISRANLTLNGTQVNTDSPASHITFLGAGYWNYTYTYPGNQNYSANSTTRFLTINKADTNQYLSLTLNGSNANMSGVYPYTTNVTGMFSGPGGSSDVQLTLWRNTSGSVATGSFARELTTLPGGSHQYIYNASEGQNYTAGSTPPRRADIIKAPTNLSLLLNGTRANTTYNYSQTANITASLNVSGKTVSIYANWSTTNPIQTGPTPQEKTQKLDVVSGIIPGLYNITANWTGDENHTKSSESWFLTVEDAGAPKWYDNTTTPASNSEYNPTTTYTFSINWTDDYEIDDVIFEFNGTDYRYNLSQITRVGDNVSAVYSKTISGLPANETGYLFRWRANDSTGNINQTPTMRYIIRKNQTEITVLLNSSHQNKTYTYPDAVNVSANKTVSGGTFTLYRNGTQIGSTSSNFIQSTQAPSAGYWNYTTQFVHENYTAVRSTLFATMNKGNPSDLLKVHIDDVNANKTITYGVNTKVNGNFSGPGSGSMTLRLFHNHSGTELASGSAPVATHLYGVNVYKFKVNTTGNENWTSGSSNELNLTVRKAATKTTAFLNSTAANKTYNYSDVANITSMSNISGVTVNLYKNDTLMSSGITPVVNISKLNSTFGWEIGIYNVSTNTSGNENYSSSNNWSYLTVVDLDPPTVTLLSPNHDTWFSTRAHWFNCTATDNYLLSHVALWGNFTGVWQLNETVNARDASTFQANFSRTLGDGVYNWNCRANDTSSNVGFASANRTAKIDATAPNVFPTRPLNDTVVAGTIDVNATVTDAMSGVRSRSFRYENSTFTSSWFGLNGTLNTNTLLDGNYTIRYNGTDLAGNANTTQTHLIAVDNTAPADLAFILPTPANNSIYKHTNFVANLSFTDSNPGSCLLELNNGTQQNITMTLRSGSLNTHYCNATISNQPYGKLTYKVYVLDTRHIVVSETRHLTIDNRPPTWSSVSPVNGTQVELGDSVGLNASWEDDFSNLSVSILETNESGIFHNKTVYGSPIVHNNVKLNWSNFTWENDSMPIAVVMWRIWTNDTNGTHGNFNATDWRRFSIGDTQPPIVTLLAPDNQTWHRTRTLSYNCTATDNYRLSHIALFSNFTGSWSMNETRATAPQSTYQENFTKTVSDGVYLWNCRANDTSNNFAFAAVNWTVKIDTTGPTSSVQQYPTGENGWYNSSPQIVNFTCNDSLSGCSRFNYSVNGGPWTELINNPPSGVWSRNITFTLGNGNHSVDYYHTDNATNQETVKRIWIAVDAAIPDIVELKAFRDATSARIPDDTWQNYDDSPYFNWTNASSISGNTYYFTQGSNPADPNQNSGSTANLFIDNTTNNFGQGENLTKVRPRSGSGIWGITRNFKLKYDTVRPNIVPILPLDESYVSGTIKVNATWSDALSGIRSASFRWEKDPLGILAGSWIALNGTLDTTDLDGDANYTIRYNATDNAGNSNTSETRKIIVDNTPPTNITYKPPTPANASIYKRGVYTVNVSFEEENPAECKLELNNGTLQNLTMNLVDVTQPFPLKENDHCWLTLNSQPHGISTYKVFVVDRANNTNASQRRHITIDIRPPNFTTILPASGTFVEYGDSINLSVRWTDDFSNLNVSILETNESGIFHNKTTYGSPISHGQVVSNWSNFTWLNLSIEPTTIVGWRVWTNDTNGTASVAGDFNASQLRTFIVRDTTPPKWSHNKTNPASPVTYSETASYQFNITWTDNFKVSDVVFEFNGMNHSYLAGELTRTGTASSGNYTKDFGSIAAGTYTYRWYANDTSGNMNVTPALTYTINRANHNIHLRLNDTDGDFTTTYGDTTNATGWLEITQVASSAVLRLNGTQVNSSSPASHIDLLAAGYWNYTYTYPQSQNYTANSSTRFLTVNKATTEITMLLNGTNADRTYAYPESINATGNKSVAGGYLTLFRNGSVVANGTEGQIYNISQMSPNFYNYTIQITHQNYTASQATRFATVLKGPTRVNVTVSGSDQSPRNFIQGTVFNVTVEINISGTRVVNYTNNFTVCTYDGDICEIETPYGNSSGPSIHVNETNSTNFKPTTYYVNGSFEGDVNYSASSDTPIMVKIELDTLFAPYNATIKNMSLSEPDRHTKLNITWEYEWDNNDGFWIERKESGASAHIKIPGTFIRNFTDTGLSADRNYTYRVWAYRNVPNQNSSSVIANNSHKPENLYRFSSAQVPGAPDVSGETITSIRFKLRPLTNPAYTEFLTQVCEGTDTFNNDCVGGVRHIGTDGTLTSSEVWMNHSQYGGAGGILVTGLTQNSIYYFRSRANNTDFEVTDWSVTSGAATGIANPNAPEVAFDPSVVHMPVKGQLKNFLRITNKGSSTEEFTISILNYANAEATFKESIILGPDEADWVGFEVIYNGGGDGRIEAFVIGSESGLNATARLTIKPAEFGVPGPGFAEIIMMLFLGGGAVFVVSGRNSK